MTIVKNIRALLVAGLMLANMSAYADNSVVAVFKTADKALYRVSHAMLTAKGIDLTGTPVTDIGLYQGGRRPWGVRVVGTPNDRSVFGQGAYLLFAGLPRDDRFNDNGRYTLKVDADIAPSHAVVDHSDVATGYAVGYHWSSEYSTQFTGYHSDSPSSLPYYTHRLTTTGSSGDVSEDIMITLNSPHVGSGNAVVAVDMWGGIANRTLPYAILVNGVAVGSGNIEGEQRVNARFVFPRSVLRDGENRITVTAKTTGRYGRIFAGRARIGTAYRHMANENAAVFYQGNRSVARPHVVGGFTVPAVFVVHQRGRDMTYYTKDAATLDANGTYTIRVPGKAESGHYFVSSWGGTKAPEITVPDYTLEQNARYSTNAGVFFIAPSDFIDSLPLAQLKTAVSGLGYSVNTVSVESIYDEYYAADGRISPLSIQRFIRHASRSKGGQYFVLIGGESHDQLDRLGLGSFSMIPTNYVETPSARQTPSDSLYGDTDIPFDYIPDVSVSRLPAFTIDELQHMVNKSIAFIGTSNATSLFISDKNDAFNSNYSFLSDSQQIGNRLTGIEQQLSLQTTGIAPLRSTILSRLNNGVSVVNYVGHSSLTKFGLQDTILDDVDAFNLTNVNSPFMLNMLGCNSNDYTLPSSSSLGMSFLLGNQSGGAVSVLGQTARVNPFHSTELAKDYYLGLSNGLTQGKALIAAQQAFAEKQGNNLSRRDVLVGTSLLGLPTLTLPQ